MACPPCPPQCTCQPPVKKMANTNALLSFTRPVSQVMFVLRAISSSPQSKFYDALMPGTGITETCPMDRHMVSINIQHGSSTHNNVHVWVQAPHLTPHIHTPTPIHTCSAGASAAYVMMMADWRVVFMASGPT